MITFSASPRVRVSTCMAGFCRHLQLRRHVGDPLKESRTGGIPFPQWGSCGETHGFYYLAGIHCELLVAWRRKPSDGLHGYGGDLAGWQVGQLLMSDCSICQQHTHV